MAENIIELEHVDAGYPGAVILRDVSFEVKRGEVFILLGGSGCGKSTIMKHMIGLNPILAGTLRVAGMEWSAKTRDALFHKIGVMYQSGALFGSMTCLENVMLPLEEFSRLKRAARRRAAIARWSSLPTWGSPTRQESSQARFPAVCANAPRSRARWPSSRR